MGLFPDALRHAQPETPWQAVQFSIASLLIGGLVYIVGNGIYNLYFHPLAAFPGPFMARASLLWRMLYSMSGRFHATIEKQHRRHGPVVRISPNELSFSSVTSWKAIYGHTTPGKAPLVKSEFYDMYGSGYESGCIGSERDPQKHSRMKRSLTAAFSTKALLEQEDIVQHCIDRFIEKIGRLSLASAGGVDVTEWYEMVAFDILGEMAFGESFNCVRDEKPHFWPELILKHLFFITLMDNLRRYSVLLTIGKYLLPRWTVGVRNKHGGYSRGQVARRLNNQTSRKDFLTNVVDKVKTGEVSPEEITAHASTLIIAGGETVSTFMAAVTFYLLKNPDSYAKLANEIRARYSSYEEIDAKSAQQLVYLQAVIHEGLRIYPPGSQGFPRLSPGTNIDGFWIPKGVEVYTSAWTVTHDPQYFHEPMSFKPERWLDPDCKDVKEASQPFSLGPRGCLGRNFAYVEMSLMLAKIFYQYDLELVDKDLNWEGQSHMHVMWWKPALHVRFHERK